MEQRSTFLTNLSQGYGVVILTSPTLTSGEDDQLFRAQFALSLGLMVEA